MFKKIRNYKFNYYIKKLGNKGEYNYLLNFSLFRVIKLSVVA